MSLPGRLRRRVRLLDPRRRCLDSLQQSPIALYDEGVPLALLFNAKAGCTFAIKWFFFQAGLLDEALAYSAWPHRYRQEVFYQRPGYFASLAAVPALGPRAVKVVRNPYDRVVSSYLHISLAAARGDLRAVPIVEAIGRRIGRHVGEDAPFSFREFVDYLGSVDLDAADPHLRRQIGACERAGRIPRLRIVRIEDSREVLPLIEAELGLRASDYEELRRSPHHTARADLPGFFGDTPFGDPRGKATPRTFAFYDETLVARVGFLYGEDCEAYGYEPPGLSRPG